MKLAKGKEMETVLFIFIGCAILMFAAIFIYNRNESTAFHESQKQILDLRLKIKELETLLTSNISTVAQGNMRLKLLDEKVICYTGHVDRAMEDVDNLQEHCAKLRESQISIKEMIASRRPITKIQGPIEVQIVTPQAKLKADAQKVKNQIKDMGL